MLSLLRSPKRLLFWAAIGVSGTLCYRDLNYYEPDIDLFPLPESLNRKKYWTDDTSLPIITDDNELERVARQAIQENWKTIDWSKYRLVYDPISTPIFMDYRTFTSWQEVGRLPSREYFAQRLEDQQKLSRAIAGEFGADEREVAVMKYRLKLQRDEQIQNLLYYYRVTPVFASLTVFAGITGLLTQTSNALPNVLRLFPKWPPALIIAVISHPNLYWRSQLKAAYETSHQTVTGEGVLPVTLPPKPPPKPLKLVQEIPEYEPAPKPPPPPPPPSRPLTEKQLEMARKRAKERIERAERLKEIIDEDLRQRRQQQ